MTSETVSDLSEPVFESVLELVFRELAEDVRFTLELLGVLATPRGIVEIRRVE